MMERIARELPLACYGLKQDSSNVLCPSCAHKPACAEAMGHRLGKIPLSRVKFSFVPSGLKHDERFSDNNLADPDLDDIEALYQACHKVVYGRFSDNAVGEWARPVTENIRTSGVSARMFMTTCMVAHLKTSNANFNPVALTKKSSLSRVKVYEETCREQHACFDFESLQLVTKETMTEDSLEARMLRTETFVGDYVVSFKLTDRGSALPSLFEEREMALDVNWLATDENYYNQVLVPHLQTRSGTRMQVKFRYAVSKIRGELKRHSKRAVAVFKARESIMSQAIRNVLRKHNLEPDDIEYPDCEVIDAAKFWNKIGLAVQHWECLKYLDGLPNCYSKGLPVYRAD